MMLRQRMVLGGHIGVSRVARRRCGGAVCVHTLCAWGVSVIVHAGVFGALWFSRPGVPGIAAGSAGGGFVPLVRTTWVSASAQASSVVVERRMAGELKVRESVDTTAHPIVERPGADESAAQETAGDMLVTVHESLDAEARGGDDLIASATGGLPLSEGLAARGVQQSADASSQSVCFVVDCSGSMTGIFERVRRHLKDSIAKLGSDRDFCLIFFGGGKLFEFSGGSDNGGQRATPQTEQAAYRFIDSIEPGGRTNALPALQRALRKTGDGRDGPSVVYLLTDGFDLAGRDTRLFQDRLLHLGGLRREAPMTRINTIGFWPQSRDIALLKDIAGRTGGQFVLVGDEPDPGARAGGENK